jgi:hypothetical protein
MAVFTLEEASGSTIQLCESYTISGVHSHYIFGVKDMDDFYYELVDDSSPSGMTHTEIKTIIRNQLTTKIEKRVLIPVPSKMDDITIIGDNIG